MPLSIIIPCGYLSNTQLEQDRLLKFTKQLEHFQYVNLDENDEIIFIESSYYGAALHSLIKSRYKGRAKIKHLSIKLKDGEFYNQSIIKNQGVKVSENDFVLFINSDIILQNNAIDILKQSFKENENRFIICARHDIFLDNGEINENFYMEINNQKLYQEKEIILEDVGWYYILDRNYKENPIKNKIKIFTSSNFSNKLNYDFLSGYIVFGDFIACKKQHIINNPFDNDCLALTDVFIRDILFSRIKDLEFYPIHHLTSCFHLSGNDYQQQTIENSPKQKRLMKDHEYLSEQYKELRQWRIFGYHHYYNDWINKYFTKEQVRELVEKYSTKIHRQYFTDKDAFEKEYEIKL